MEKPVSPPSPWSPEVGRAYHPRMPGSLAGELMAEFNPRIHVVELVNQVFHYYRGAFGSFEEVPPRYTWRKVDFRVDDTVVYVDLQGASVDG